MQINTKALKKPKNNRVTQDRGSPIMALEHLREGIPLVLNILLETIVHLCF